MNEKILNEFAIYYKRIIRIENYLKQLIYDKYKIVHGEKSYSILFKTYFSHINNKAPFTDNRFNDINLSKKNDDEKLNLSIQKLYISEVLSFFNHKAYLKDRVRKIFFENPVETNKDFFKKHSKILKNFRNCICHFDTKQFLNEKSKFINSLIYFEKLLNSRYKYTKGRFESIEHKLSIQSILELIYQNNPEYFEDDRVLVNVFDDLALLLDYRTNNLPPYKSIIRAKFYIENKYKKQRRIL
ncbi:hypothetical protein IJ843_01795 [bacterium]|nr:hypothetical protein [bacterium]